MSMGSYILFGRMRTLCLTDLFSKLCYGHDPKDI